MYLHRVKYSIKSWDNNSISFTKPINLQNNKIKKNESWKRWKDPDMDNDLTKTCRNLKTVRGFY